MEMVKFKLRLYKNSQLILILLAALMASLAGISNGPLGYSNSSATFGSQGSLSPSTTSSSKMTAEQMPAGLYPAWLAEQQNKAGAEYNFSPAGAATNPAQHLTLKPGTQGGLKINSFTMRLLGLGYTGARFTELGSGKLSYPSPNRLEYQREQGLVEWYVNGPLGVEQGFTLNQPWPGAEASQQDWLSLQIGLEAGVASLNGNDSKRLEIVDENGAATSYDGLYAYDADGQALESKFELAEDGHGWRVLVKVSGAKYPVVVDPFLQQQPLTPSAAGPLDELGTAVALSSNGNTALVGASPKQVGNSGGAVYVFTRSGTTWSLQKEIIALDGALSDNFGNSVALSSDGNTALVGAYTKNVGDKQSQGVVYVFTRSGTTWNLQRELFAQDGVAFDYFGKSVSLSGDGNTAVIGAYNKKIGDKFGQGAAYIFTRSGTNWSQTKELTDTDIYVKFGENFGYAVAISGDGKTILVGAPFKPSSFPTNPFFGEVDIYTNPSGTGWTLTGLERPNDAASDDSFGVSVAVNSNGNTFAVGAYSKTIGNNSGQGAAYVFTRLGRVEIEQKKLVASDGAANDLFGLSVSVSGDGNTVIVGANQKKIGSNTKQGAAYVFTRSGTNWSQQKQLLASNGASGDLFGTSVALDSDGNTALTGAPTKNVGANAFQGAAFVFTRSGTNWSQQKELLAVDGTTGDSFGFSVALSADGNTALVGAPDKVVGLNTSIGAAYIFIRTGTAWSLQSRLLITDGGGGEQFGTSVALSSDGNTALVGANRQLVIVNDGFGFRTGQGAVYVYMRSAGSWRQQARIVSPNLVLGETFGSAIALSGDGATALIGAPTTQVGSRSNAGIAYVFTRITNSFWTLQQQLFPLDGASNDNFGMAVALSSNGNIALVGASGKQIGTKATQGAAYIFTRANNVWNQQKELLASDGAAGDNFGKAVALSANGSTALIGAYLKKVGANTAQGAAYVFTGAGSAWNQQKELTASDGAAGDNFGRAVALTADGNSALVGAYLKKVGANAAQGAAYLFTRSGTSWNQTQKLVASNGAAGDNFGVAVALNSTGNLSLVGASNKQIGSNARQGTAYILS